MLLLDSIGELSGLFFLADVVFMGGTLAQRGGHNILEPAFFGRPVIAGPHMENFRAIAEEFRAAEAMVEMDAAELASAVGALFGDRARAGEIGRRALACAESKRGAAGIAIEELRRLYGSRRARLPACVVSAALAVGATLAIGRSEAAPARVWRIEGACNRPW